MVTPDLRELDREPNPDTELRKIDAADLQKFLKDHWGQIQVEAAPPGEKIVRDVHGEEKKGDFLVTVGNLLTENHAGTELSAGDFIHWMVEDEGFIPSTATQKVPIQDAVDLLESSELGTDRTPILRLLRPAGMRNGSPMCFEFFGGSQSEPMRILSMIGNQNSISDKEKETYREQVFRLTKEFGAKGSTKVKDLIGVPWDIAKQKCLDDCLASLMTFLGWAKVKEYLGITEPNTLLEMGAAIGTTQALVTAKVLAEQASLDNPLNRPLVVRVGAPAFGLGNKKLGLNYIMNTQENMRKAFGWFACGDLGKNMSKGYENDIQPHIIKYGKGNPRYETIFFLNGGGPLLKMFQQHYADRGKPIDGVFSVVRASRVGEENDWGALFTPPEVLIHEKLHPNVNGSWLQ